jgi:hypothetical protein
VPEKSRTSWPFASLTVLCAAAIVAALMGATSPLSASQFANTGHWVYNSTLGTIFHIDGATTNIDAQVPMDAEVGSQVLQSDTSGYVVGESRITEFDKASLEERQSSAPPADETPLGIEVVGGPYVVYRNAGQIVRLGDPAATISAGGAIGNPVVTEDGTMWLHRNGSGEICRLGRDAVELSGCPVSAPKDHAGAMTIVDGRPAFLDLFTSQLHTIDGDTLGQGVALGVPLSPNSRPAAQDTAGRVAILDPARSSLILVDTRNQPATSVAVTLPSGDYDGPVSTGEVVALVDRQKGAVLTYGADGAPKDEVPLKDNTGEPRLHRGEDQRIYVEDADGTQVLVVDTDGGVQGVDVAGKPATPAEQPTQAPEQPTETGPPAGPPASAPVGPRPGPTNPPPVTNTPPPPPPPVPPSRPGAPPSVSAVAGNGSATVTWGPAADNRSPITSYTVSWPGGSIPVGPGATQATVNNLANGTTYVFTVTATNQVGPGPGASSNAVTPVSPVSPAAAPNVQISYDQDDDPSRDVTVTWQQPELNGGTLVHYEVTVTGKAPQNVTGTQYVEPQVEHTATVTFTVRAVTRAPDGQTLDGQPASVTHPGEPPARINLTRGPAVNDPACDGQPDCAWMHVVMTGFASGTRYDVMPYNDAGDGYTNPGYGTTTDANGYSEFDRFAYTGPGENVWVEVVVDGVPIRSNLLRW